MTAPRRQILTFSATYPKNLSRRIASIMRDAVVVRECVDDLNELEVSFLIPDFERFIIFDDTNDYFSSSTFGSQSGGLVEDEVVVEGSPRTSSGGSSVGSGATPSLLGVAQYYSLLPSVVATGDLNNSGASKRRRKRNHYEKFVCKLGLVRDILLNNPFNQCIVFTNHRGHALTMTKKLQAQGDFFFFFIIFLFTIYSLRLLFLKMFFFDIILLTFVTFFFVFRLFSVQ